MINPRRILILWLAIGCAYTAEPWIDQVESLLRYDPEPTAWQALVPKGDPGDHVPADARKRWQREQDDDSSDIPTPVPPEDERDELGVPTPAAVRAAPDRLIPATKLFIGNADRQRHDRAVTSLIQFHLKDARMDALRPLVPWLLDPAWSTAPDRNRLIQSLSRVIVPEAEGGLLRVLEHESGWERRAAAEALAAMGCTSAIPLLRRLTTDGTNLEDHLMAFLRARAALGGFTEAEALQALEAFARASDDQERFSLVNGTAMVVSETPMITTDALARLVLARGVELAAEPPIAQRLHDLVTTWSVPAALDAFLDDLASGQVRIWPLVSHLRDPAALRRERGERLRTIARSTGPVAGFATILLGDPTALDQALASNDAALVASLCAAGRLTGEQPPAAIAAAVDHPSPVVQRAALLWAVETTDPTVRAAIYARNAGQMIILGRMPGWDPGHHTKDGFAGWEARLRHQLRQPDPPTRILALLSGSYWGETEQMIIEERAIGARLILAPDRDRFRIRDLGTEELAAFRQTMDQVGVSRLPAAEFYVDDGTQYEHVELDSSGGFRVWMNNPQTQPASPWEILVHAWWELGKKTTPVQWPVLDTIVGARVLYDGGVDGLACAAVDGSDGVRILRRHFYHNDDPTGTGWFRLADGKTTPCDRPAQWPEVREPPKGYNISQRRGWQALVAGSEVVEGNPYGESKTQSGLWWLLPDNPTLFAAGMYRTPVAIPGTTTVLVEKALGEYWSETTQFQVIDCHTGAATPCNNIPPGRWITLAWIAARNAFLLESWEPDGRATSDDPAIAAEGEVALALGGGLRPAQNSRLLWLDPHTGIVTPTTGDPTPLRDLDHRPLQPVLGREGLVWATLPLRHGTRIGHYDPAQLVFTPVAQVDGLDFSGEECWVDEADDRVLISLRGDLLLVPLAGLRLPAAKP